MLASFPRCKSNLYDSGARVPLAIRFGKHIPAGRTVEDFVSLVDIGGLAYLGRLVKETPSAANIQAYAGIVRERSVLRQLIQVGTEISDSDETEFGDDEAPLATEVVDDADDWSSATSAEITRLEDRLANRRRADEERLLVELLAAHPAGHLVVALAGVARPARGYDVVEGVPAAT